MSDAVLRELDGLRALARSLVHGDAEADDLLQDAAIAAIRFSRAALMRWLDSWSTQGAKERQ